MGAGLAEVESLSLLIPIDNTLFHLMLVYARISQKVGHDPLGECNARGSALQC